MRFQIATILAVAAGSVVAQPAGADTLSPVSYVKGKAFDRLAVIWLENTDYAMAIGDREQLLFFLQAASIHRADTDRQSYSQLGVAGQ